MNTAVLLTAAKLYKIFLLQTCQLLVKCWSEMYLRTFNEQKLIAFAAVVQGTLKASALRAFQYSESHFEVFACLKLTNKYTFL